MYNDNTPVDETIEYGGERLLNQALTNASMKQLKTDTSGRWQSYRIGNLKYYYERQN